MVDSDLDRPRLPSNDLDRLFRSNRSWALKIAGAGGAGLAIAGWILWMDRNAFSTVTRLSVLIAVPVAVMLGAGVLVRADAVRRKLLEGGRVGLVSRLMFGAGIWSLLLWIIVLLLIGFPLAIWLGSLTSQRPAG